MVSLAGQSCLLTSTLSVYNPGQNVLGHLRKLGTKMHFAIKINSYSTS